MTALGREVQRQFAQELADTLGDPVNVRTVDAAGNVVGEAVRAEPRLKTEAEINAEKAAKPRPDLLPARELARVAYQAHSMVAADVFSALSRFEDTLDPESLAFVVVTIARWEGCSVGELLLHAGDVMGYGFRKHGRCTWRVAGTEQADPQTHYASGVRHLLERMDDADAREEGSGRPVLWHAAAQFLITLDLLADPPTIEGVNDGRGMITGRP